MEDGVEERTFSDLNRDDQNCLSTEQRDTSLLANFSEYWINS